MLANRGKKGYTKFVVHTNTMNDRDFERYEQLFAENRDRLLSYAELLGLEPAKRGLFGNGKEYLMAIVKYLLVCLRGSKR